MGFLTLKAETYKWLESIPMQDVIKRHGLNQLIKLWKTFSGLQIPIEELKWGEEVEYHVFSLKDEEKIAQIYAEGFIVAETKKVEGFNF